MSISILDEIVQLRINDIEKKGVTLGFSVPKERTRAITPFMDTKGAILEIKRASPSKGDIAVDLDEKQTALEYCKAGAKAISVLTESHYFKGELDDLVSVCDTVDSYKADNKECTTAVLRKDFLLYPDEVDVSYLCGADAVLLISRILDEQTMIAMAKRCQSLGITALIELRQDEDLVKLGKVVEQVDTRYIVCGVNSRDLKDFSIDFLTPASLLNRIKAIAGDDARVIFESGIRTPDAALFVGSLGFTGMLLGEAAARNPKESTALVNGFISGKTTQEAKQWLDYADKKESCKKTRVKICGITNKEDAIKACELGADFLGFIIWNKSKRCCNVNNIPEIAKALQDKGLRKLVKLVAVIVEPESEEAIKACSFAKEGIIDFIQLHSLSDYVLQKRFNVSIPHYCAVNIGNEQDIKIVDDLRYLGEPRILIDAKAENQIGGTGITIAKDLVDKVSHKTKVWLAGGINPDNVEQILTNCNPELIDISSGVELSPGKKDYVKLEKLFEKVKIYNGEI